ncbi:hypothetical protein QOZ84_03270 [Romboutsia sedimentorum]|uniref:Uncharacterized protein n=1 Tax=Romboutsia sedimentorum TaxID=1368474 RepID=A0ABT7E6P6_9FIRM|nr:hypothetical protein [Romboutsia sedimentorum]MDK2562557.1 hypothetical protein [Romboutsia sedimentorum]
MKKLNLSSIIYRLVASIQSVIIVATFIIQYLTNKKAGVMHHVYYKKYQFENGIFSPENLQVQKIISIILIIIFLVLLAYFMKKRVSKFFKVQLVITTILSIMLFIVVSSGYFASKLAYHYFIIAFSLVLVIQVVVTMFSYKKLDRR